MIRQVPGGVEIVVKVVPGSSRNQLAGQLGDALKVRVSAPPEKGRANAAVAALLADRLGVAGKDVTLISGEASPRKTFCVRGVSVAQARMLLTKI